jgi:hypothetical protein
VSIGRWKLAGLSRPYRHHLPDRDRRLPRRHSNPTTGGDSQLLFVSEAGLGEAAEAFWAVACSSSALEAFWAVACLNSALLARATAERGAILAW